MNSMSLEVHKETGAPTRHTRKLTPFGDFIGWENITWTSFSPGEPPVSAWAGFEAQGPALDADCSQGFAAGRGDARGQCEAGTATQCDAGGAALQSRADEGNLHAILAMGLREGVRKSGGNTAGMVREMPPWMPHVGAGGAQSALALAQGAGQGMEGQVLHLGDSAVRREWDGRAAAQGPLADA